MLTGNAAIELGRLSSPDADTTGPRHRLLYLAEQATVVMPYARTKDGWECVVVASRRLRPAHHVVLADGQVAAGLLSIPTRPEKDPDGYARLVWLSQVFRHWPGGAVLAMARHLVDARLPASTHIPIDALRDHAGIAAGLPTSMPVAVGRLLGQLVAAGFLARAGQSLWRLTLPPASADAVLAVPERSAS